MWQIGIEVTFIKICDKVDEYWESSDGVKVTTDAGCRCSCGGRVGWGGSEWGEEDAAVAAAPGGRRWGEC